MLTVLTVENMKNTVELSKLDVNELNKDASIVSKGEFFDIRYINYDYSNMGNGKV